MFSFLSAPALTEGQVAQTAQAVQTGYKEGAKAVADREEREANAVAADKKEKAATALERSKLDAAAAEKRIALLHSGAKETYDTTRARINDTISGLTTIMDPAKGVSPNSPEYSAAQLAAGIANDHLDALDQGRAKYLASDQSQAETFDPNASTLTGASSIPMLPLRKEEQQAKDAKLESERYGGALKKAEYDAKYGPGATPARPKVDTHAASAADTFSGAQSTLDEDTAVVSALPKDAKGAPKDPVRFNQAITDLRRKRDLVESSFARTANYAAAGAYGADVQSAYGSLAKSLPAGADPSQISNHGALRAAFLAKQAAGTATPADIRLAQHLRLDRDISGSWNAGTKAALWGSATDAPLMPMGSFTPSSTGAATGASGSSSPALLPAPDASDESSSGGTP